MEPAGSRVGRSTFFRSGDKLIAVWVVYMMRRAANVVRRCFLEAGSAMPAMHCITPEPCTGPPAPPAQRPLRSGHNHDHRAWHGRLPADEHQPRAVQLHSRSGYYGVEGD